jgi:hypothetical protein
MIIHPPVHAQSLDILAPELASVSIKGIPYERAELDANDLDTLALIHMSAESPLSYIGVIYPNHQGLPSLAVVGKVIQARVQLAYPVASLDVPGKYVMGIVFSEDKIFRHLGVDSGTGLHGLAFEGYPILNDYSLDASMLRSHIRESRLMERFLALPKNYTPLWEGAF